MSESKQARDKGGKDVYPVLPLRDIVVFPYMIVPLFVGREKSINALEEVMRSDKQILLAAQKNAGDTNRPYRTGRPASRSDSARSRVMRDLRSPLSLRIASSWVIELRSTATCRPTS